MAVQSAGLLMCRKKSDVLEFFLIHPGGPFYARKNDGVWSIPKGLLEENEDAQQAAIREFHEETGIVSTPPYHSLGVEKMRSGKLLHVWTFIGEWDESSGITSNMIDILWPPRSNKFMSIPEADKGAWMIFDVALKMINQGQLIFLRKAKDFYQTC